MAALRNGTFFALGMSFPGAMLLLWAFLRSNDMGDRGGWETFVIIYPAYVLMYALASFAVVSLVWRRFRPISRDRLAFWGLVAGCSYVITGLLLDPLWHEPEFILSWLAVAAVFGSLALARPGTSGA